MSDAVTVIAPATSSRARAPSMRAAGRSFSESATTMRPIGKLTRKIQCQSRESVRTPPSVTPMLPPPAATNPNTPIALARSAGSVKRVIMSESETADAIAPPTPWTARAPMQDLLARRKPAGQRREREQRDADEEQPPVAVEVAEASAQEQAPAEGEQVGVHDPRERRLREAEVLPDRRQRDVHDGRVEHDHQASEAQDVEGEPAGAVVHRHRGVSPFEVVLEALDGPAARNSSVARR